MTCEVSNDICSVVSQEFDKWQEENPNGTVILLEVVSGKTKECLMNLLLGSEYEVKLHIPEAYPNHEGNFFVESDSVIQFWTIAINEFLLDSKKPLSLSDVLNKAMRLFTEKRKQKAVTEEFSSEEDEDEAEETEEEEELEEDSVMIVADEEAFTTEWDLKVTRKKMRWSKREPVVRELMKKKRIEQGLDACKKPTAQIFTSTAASGILTNDLVKIMECEEECGFSAEPIQDNIYHWRVRLFKFHPDSELNRDLSIIKTKHGYDYIEMEMTFEIDLFPFFPPLVKVIRPRLQGCMMQRITNIEFLQLSYWSPAKDMKSVIQGLKDFLQQWARIDVLYDRNDLSRCPYLDIEHHLLTLAQVSEMTPRANQVYTLDEDKIKELKTSASVLSGCPKELKTKEEYWAKGVGFGHDNRPGWDIDAYVAAQKEKDNKIESALRDILKELKTLQTDSHPSMDSEFSDMQGASSSCVIDSRDHVDDIFAILEGSVLIPCVEQHLRVDSFLEINRHSAVYIVIINVIRELAYRKDWLPLLCALHGQRSSIFQLLENLNGMASIMLEQIHKPANGCIPENYLQADDFSDTDSSDSESQVTKKCSLNKLLKMKQTRSAQMPQMPRPSSEERLAREFTILFKLVSHSIDEQSLHHTCRCGETSMNGEASNGTPDTNGSNSCGHILHTGAKYLALESQYKSALKKEQFKSCDIPLEGKKGHHFAVQFASGCRMSTQTQVVRIAQELSSLSSALPLELSSGIFIRTDDEKISVMKALITGPEGTPYSSGCYVFDIYFPSSYPKSPPKVNLETTGNGSVRFNPNLYNCGRVCLSLLGTWQGQNGEVWNEKTSTILQVLVSIQSLILVPDPYFNEPGYEQTIGTENGKKLSDEYNKNVRINNIQYAMIQQLQHPQPGFKEVIRTHFYLKKSRVLEEVHEWVRSCKCSRMEQAYSALKKEFKKLDQRPGLSSTIK